MRLAGDACCSAHCESLCICDEDQSESHFAWQAQYLVRLAGDACSSAHCKYIYIYIYVTRIHDASHFAWQAQHLVMLEDEICCSAHCK